MRSLLDINVVIALLDPDHTFHHRAHAWWGSQAKTEWASSPITENGVVRIMSHPSYNPRRSLSPGDVVTLLRTFVTGTDHQFWPDSVSFIDDRVIDHSTILGPRQVTDVYLLALAIANNGRLATFDGSIHRAAAKNAGTECLLVI